MSIIPFPSKDDFPKDIPLIIKTVNGKRIELINIDALTLLQRKSLDQWQKRQGLDTSQSSARR
jgi:hypothetical protein